MSEKPISPLRQRMLEDMNVRRFTPDTQREYVRAVKRLAAFLGRTPDTATAEETAGVPPALSFGKQGAGGTPAVPGSSRSGSFLVSVRHRPPRRHLGLAEQAHQCLALGGREVAEDLGNPGLVSGGHGAEAAAPLGRESDQMRAAVARRRLAVEQPLRQQAV